MERLKSTKNQKNEELRDSSSKWTIDATAPGIRVHWLFVWEVRENILYSIINKFRQGIGKVTLDGENIIINSQLTNLFN